MIFLSPLDDYDERPEAEESYPSHPAQFRATRQAVRAAGVRRAARRRGQLEG